MKLACENKFITLNEFKFMVQSHPIHPVFYTLPKIHKSLTEPVPGRPIVAGTQSLTEPLSPYIDLFVKPLVFELPSYLKDMTDFLKLSLVSFDPEIDWLCTMDVTSLYTNVPHREGLQALEFFLDRRGILTTPTGFLIDLTELVLLKKYFKFENHFYLQAQGVSMGSPCSPNYANCFFGKFELDYVGLYNNNPFSDRIKWWYRFIDDIFFIFRGSKALLEQFYEFINSRLPSIKFTLESSGEKVSFLDVLVEHKGQLVPGV